MTLLVDAVREAASQADSQRRLFVVPNAHVARLQTSGGVVTGIQAFVNGAARVLPVSAGTSVILALGTIESTRMALASFPRTPLADQELMGRNLMGHVRIDTYARIRRSALDPGNTLPVALQTAALLLRGSTPQGRFHIQVTASADPGGNSDAFLFTMIPDIDQLNGILNAQQNGWISFALRGSSETVGDTTTPVPNGSGRWLNLSPFESDEFGVPRAYVQMNTSTSEDNLATAMENSMIATLSPRQQRVLRRPSLVRDGRLREPNAHGADAGAQGRRSRGGSRDRESTASLKRISSAAFKAAAPFLLEPARPRNRFEIAESGQTRGRVNVLCCSAMDAKSWSLVSAFAAGCLSGALIIGSRLGGSAEGSSGTARESVRKAAERSEAPSERLPARSSEVAPAASVVVASGPPSHADVAVGQEPASEGGDSVADVLARLEAEYRQHGEPEHAAEPAPAPAASALAATATAPSAAVPPTASSAVASAATPTPAPATAPKSSATPKTNLDSERIPALADASEASAASEQPALAPSLAVGTVDLPSDTAAENGQQRISAQLQQVAALQQVALAQQTALAQQLAILQYLQLVSASPNARSPAPTQVQRRGHSGRIVDTLPSSISASDNPWGFVYPAPVLLH